MTRPNIFAALALLGLCLAATVTSLGNDFAQDDMPVIQQNPVVHELSKPAAFFTQSYWPKPFPPALYRPLATTGFAVQWKLGGGSPLAFRVTSILMYFASGLAVLVLARRLLSPGAAWIAAALFMIHPVHVEATAVAVNQSEIIVGLLACLTVLYYMRARRDERFTLRHGSILFVLYLAATLFKESGLMIIGLIVAAELTVVRDTRPLVVRLAAIRPLLLVMLLGATSFFAIRTLALGGDPVGTFTAEALAGQSMGGRALTMLGIVPHWFRLLLWPAHLRGDYSPREIEQATAWGLDQTQGATLLLLAIALVVVTWKRYPVIAFGLLWTGIGLFPVSNILVPTGIVLAERTLFLPSIGMMLTLGGLATPLLEHLRSVGRPVRIVAGIAFGAVVLMGVTRSASRQRVWKDQFTFWHQTTIDAPFSYRARHALAQLLFQAGARGMAEREYRLAIALYPTNWGAMVDFADKLRLDGQCSPAVPLYHQALALSAEQTGTRMSLIACFLDLGRYAEARDATREALRHITYAPNIELFQSYLRTADSAAAVGAPPGTVKLPPPPTDTAQ